MSPVLTVIVVLLIPAGLLPIVTAWALRRYRSQPSQSLRDRWHLSLVLAALGGIVSVIAANRLLGWGVEGEALILPFALVLLLVDVVSGRWLLDHMTGKFDLPAPDTPEDVIDRHAREARRVLLEVAERTARDLARAEVERELATVRVVEAAERTAEDQKRSADASERTAEAAERTADNTEAAS